MNDTGGVYMKYGISYLPSGNIAYDEGYRYGAYTISDNGETTITDFFKTKNEIQKFIDENPKYGKNQK